MDDFRPLLTWLLVLPRNCPRRSIFKLEKCNFWKNCAWNRITCYVVEYPWRYPILNLYKDEFEKLVHWNSVVFLLTATPIFAVTWWLWSFLSFLLSLLLRFSCLSDMIVIFLILAFDWFCDENRVKVMSWTKLRGLDVCMTSVYF